MLNSGIKPSVRKTEPIDNLSPPKSLSQLKSFMRSMHSLYTYLPALAEYPTQLRPLLSKIIHNSFRYAGLKNTAGVVKAKSRIPSVSASKSATCKLMCKSPADEGGKLCAQASNNQIAEICILECNDRKGAKVVKSNTECQLRELQNISTPTSKNRTCPMASINLKKLNTFL